jgi:hypothetical protein
VRLLCHVTEKKDKISSAHTQIDTGKFFRKHFNVLLPFASRLFLTPLAKSALCKFACHFYTEEKVKETKSDPNYVSSSAKKLGIVLQATPEVQESQGFKALHNGLTAKLEKFCAMITQEYVLNREEVVA